LDRWNDELDRQWKWPRHENELRLFIESHIMTGLLTKFGLPLVSLVLIAVSVQKVSESQKALPKMPPPMAPASNPFPLSVAGAGMIEAETENISVGATLPGVVTEVLVQVGQNVTVGTPLFKLDDRQLRAELQTRKAALATAEAEVRRLRNEPRPERVQMAEAELLEAKARLADAKDQLQRVRRLYERKVATQEDFVAKDQAFAAADARVRRAQAEVDLIRAGAWEYDLAVARTNVDQVKSQINQIETDLDRLVVRALSDAEVLQIKVRPGEFVATPAASPLMVLGSVKKLHVRVDIDEYDIPRFDSGAPARATLRGNPNEWFPLSFVRVEPYVVPKKSLTGDNTERVDTRVLQVIYAIDATDTRLYVGQQVDVFIDAASSSNEQN
jgi:multidrug resistance efflux pump